MTDQIIRSAPDDFPTTPDIFREADPTIVADDIFEAERARAAIETRAVIIEVQASQGDHESSGRAVVIELATLGLHGLVRGLKAAGQFAGQAIQDARDGYAGYKYWE